MAAVNSSSNQLYSNNQEQQQPSRYILLQITTELSLVKHLANDVTADILMTDYL